MANVQSGTVACTSDCATAALTLTLPGSAASSDYERYAYDANSNRTCMRKRDGSKLVFTYDNLNRVLSKVVAATSGGVCP